MPDKTIFCLIGLLIASALAPARTAWALSQLVLSPSGARNFVLEGTDLSGVASMDLTLTYDASVWANPHLDQGELVSGAMTAVNSSSPGILRIGMIRTTPIQGSGVIAVLSFGSREDGACDLLSLKARLTSLDGSLLPVMVRVSNSENPEADGFNK
jgi:hypothetical protein